ncbi:MAG: iron-sulfur cluster assembly scaffold protein [Steroidobacteraceae bacterium]
MSAELQISTDFAYSDRVRELFNNLHHAGMLSVDQLAGVVVKRAAVGLREHGACVTIWITLHDAKLQAVRYQAYGCPYFLAACESLAQWLQGRDRAELSQWRWRDVETALAIPANKRSRLLLLDEAINRLAND